MNIIANHERDESHWYLNEQLDFDRQMIKFRYETIKKFFRGKNCLELGSAEGVMTDFLVNDFDNVTSVDGSKELLDIIPEYTNLIKIHSYFENFDPKNRFDTIIMEHILEHVADPISLMNRAKDWLAPNGVILLGVPNSQSFHRLAAVKMGLLKTPETLNERDISLGHHRVYSMESFSLDIRKAGLSIIQTGGVFFKPVSNKQIQENWTQEMIEGFFALGHDFPEYAAEIYAVCEA